MPVNSDHQKENQVEIYDINLLFRSCKANGFGKLLEGGFERLNVKKSNLVLDPP